MDAGLLEEEARRALVNPLALLAATGGLADLHGASRGAGNGEAGRVLGQPHHALHPAGPRLGDVAGHPLDLRIVEALDDDLVAARQPEIGPGRIHMADLLGLFGRCGDRQQQGQGKGRNPAHGRSPAHLVRDNSHRAASLPYSPSTTPSRRGSAPPWSRTPSVPRRIRMACNPLVIVRTSTGKPRASRLGARAAALV